MWVPRAQEEEEEGIMADHISGGGDYGRPLLVEGGDYGRLLLLEGGDMVGQC